MSGIDDMAEPPAAEEASYTYRPSLLGAPWTFRLTENGLVWQAGRRSGQTAYRDIRRIRMSFRPVSMQANRYLTEIWGDGAPKVDISSSSWKSMMEQERLEQPYGAFIADLHRRIAASGATPVLERGTSPLLYLPGFVVFAGVSIGIAVLTLRALQSDTIAGAAFIAAFLALFLWQAGRYFMRNKPGRYAIDALPAEVMPPVAR